MSNESDTVLEENERRKSVYSIGNSAGKRMVANNQEILKRLISGGRGEETHLSRGDY